MVSDWRRSRRLFMLFSWAGSDGATVCAVLDGLVWMEGME